MTMRIEVYESSGNVFADIGLPNADVHLLKAQIVSELYRLCTRNFHRLKLAFFWESANQRSRACSMGISMNIQWSG